MTSPGGSARAGPDVREGASLPSSPPVSRQSYVLRRIGLSVLWVLLFLLLNRPEIIVLKQFGSSVWYPAAGFALFYILMLGPAYAVVAALSSSLAGILIYHDPLLCWISTVGEWPSALATVSPHWLCVRGGASIWASIDARMSCATCAWPPWQR
jgi:hypothetical protein